MKIDPVESAVGCSNLILPPAGFGAQVALKLDSLLCEVLFRDVGSLRTMEGVEHAHRERRRRAKPRSRWKVGLVRYSHLVHSEHGHGVSNRRMLEIRRVGHAFDFRIHQFISVIEKTGQMPSRNIAILIEGGGYYRPAMCVEKLGDIGPPAEKRHPKRSARDNHRTYFSFRIV